MIEARHTQAGTSEIASPSRKAMVYVVDDDVDVLKSLRFLLETEGFDVRTFGSGPALLGSRVRDDADCLVIDYKMAGINGIELAYKLREFDVQTPVILITGYPDDNIPAKAGPAGVHQVLLKPHLEESLVASVRNAVDSSGAGY
jgi:two-component system, LuxR family, response regulator FixJ